MALSPPLAATQIFQRGARSWSRVPDDASESDCARSERPAHVGPTHQNMGRRVVMLLALAPLIAAVSIVYDETRWTKADLSIYLNDFDPMYSFNPSTELTLPQALKEALARSSHNSLDGPSMRRAVSTLHG